MMIKGDNMMWHWLMRVLLVGMVAGGVAAQPQNTRVFFLAQSDTNANQVIDIADAVGLYRADATATPIRLTPTDLNVTSYALDPDAGLVAYLVNAGDNTAQLYIQPTTSLSTVAADVALTEQARLAHVGATVVIVDGPRLLNLDADSGSLINQQTTTTEDLRWLVSPDGTRALQVGLGGIQQGFTLPDIALMPGLDDLAVTGQPNWSPDGQFIQYLQPNDQGLSQISVYNATDGTTQAFEASLLPANANRLVRWSDDGRYLTEVVSAGRVTSARLIDITNGETWNVPAPAGFAGVNFQTWSAGDRYAHVVLNPDEANAEKPIGMAIYDSAARTLIPLENIDAQHVAQFRWHPAEDHAVLISRTENEPQGRLYKLEGPAFDVVTPLVPDSTTDYRTWYTLYGEQSQALVLIEQFPDPLAALAGLGLPIRVYDSSRDILTPLSNEGLALVSRSVRVR